MSWKVCRCACSFLVLRLRGCGGQGSWCISGGCSRILEVPALTIVSVRISLPWQILRGFCWPSFLREQAWMCRYLSWSMMEYECHPGWPQFPRRGARLRIFKDSAWQAWNRPHLQAQHETWLVADLARLHSLRCVNHLHATKCKILSLPRPLVVYQHGPSRFPN